MNVRPKCQSRWCDRNAAWQGAGRFMCDFHFAEYSKAVTQRTPGLDPPQGASDFWRPSIADMVRTADMEIRRQERTPTDTVPSVEVDDSARVRDMTPAQRATLARLQALQRR